MCARTVYPGARARHLVKEQGYVAAGIEMLRNRGRRDLRQLATASLQAAIAPVIKTRQHRGADAGARLVQSPDTAATDPGRAAVAAWVAAERAWSRAGLGCRRAARDGRRGAQPLADGRCPVLVVLR